MKTETSHIEPGPVSKVDEWPDSCCFQPGSWERQPQCKSLRCHGGKASLAFHGLGGAYATPWSPWAGCSWYISQGWSFPCSQQVWWLHSQINKRSMPPPLFFFFFWGGCFFATFFDHLNFTDGASLGKTHSVDCCFLSGSHWRISTVRHQLQCPRCDYTVLHWISSAFVCTIFNPTSLLLLSKVVRNRLSAMFQDTDIISWRKLFKFPDKMPSASCISPHVKLGCFLISDFTLTTCSTIMAVTRQP